MLSSKTGADGSLTLQVYYVSIACPQTAEQRASGRDATQLSTGEPLWIEARQHGAAVDVKISVNAMVTDASVLRAIYESLREVLESR